MLEIGKPAPAFVLKDKDGTEHSLSSLLNDATVLFFYPKDSTPGCTTETLGFEALLPKFRRLNVTVVGISGGDERTKRKFCEKHSLSIPLLSDSDGTVGEAYSSFGPRTFMGRKYNGFFRNTVLIDKKGRVIAVFEGVKPEGHPQEILDWLKTYFRKVA